MIDLYYWTTPNGHKMTMFLEETGMPSTMHPGNIGKGDQFKAEFLYISPTNRTPAFADRAPAAGGEPIAMFESGAILLYLADKVGRFIPRDARARLECIQWLFWQMGNLGPLAGQNHHFVHYAPEKIPYAIDRYVNETGRLYAVLNKRLADREFITGEYTIADIASYTWVLPERPRQNIAEFTNFKRWKEAIKPRAATERAYAKAKEINPGARGIQTDAEKKVLFGQTKDVVR